MIRAFVPWIFPFLGLGLIFPLFPVNAQEVLRGEVQVDLEQVRGFVESPPLNIQGARDKALEEAAYYFGAMIYGWSFRYDVGEKARRIEEKLELSPLGSIAADDPRLEPGNPQVKDNTLSLWSDYRPSDTQRLRLAKWRSGSLRPAQAYGQSPLENKAAALEDAARAALRAALRGGERNRPKEVTGYISLAAFPRFWLNAGRWMVEGRFFVEIREIRPFAAY